jgi:DNA-binding NarL/FixJ family response regulator
MKGDVFLVHWREMEAAALAKEISSFGWHVDFESSDGAKVGKLIKEHHPNAVVIYLSRLPSHGRETGKALRDVKATKNIPIVFVDGNEEVIQRTKAQVPNAIYTTSEELEAILERYKNA